ncbi:MAG: hypothetical protein AUI84_07005 [Delftia sp. 13_1_40CM_3_66_6]|nr:MAG: hypothetical protein AUI84_07005 [Delftia sp. 13_1_40CM_3_66_6]
MYEEHITEEVIEVKEESLTFQEHQRQARQAGFELYMVVGIIINDPWGPRRFAEYIAALDPEMAEQVARDQVSVQVAADRHGVLFVAGVLQLVWDEYDRPGIEVVDDGVYADDPHREEGYLPPGGWMPPMGFEG